MLIGELARKTRTSRDTIRFYQRLGLVSGRVPAGGSNRYRHYDERMVARLALIHHAKGLGFSLAELRSLADAWESGSLTRAEKRKLFLDKLALADQRIADLRRVKRYLQAKLKGL